MSNIDEIKAKAEAGQDLSTQEMFDYLADVIKGYFDRSFEAIDERLAQIEKRISDLEGRV